MDKSVLFKKFNNVVSKIPNVDWANFDKYMQELDTFCWRYVKSDDTSSKRIAYMCRSKGITGVYELFINKLIPYDIKNATVLHEVGHAVLGHSLNFKRQKEEGIERIRANWSTLRDYFAKNNMQDMTNPTDKVCGKIYKMLLNIAMDFEVNSKMFEEPEYDWARLFFNFAYISIILQNNEKTSDKTLAEIEDFLDGLDTFNGKIDFESPTFPKWFSSFCWAQDYGYPNRLNYLEYIELMIKEPEKFFPTLKDNESDIGDGSDELTSEDIDSILERYGDSDPDDAEEIESDTKGFLPGKGDGDKVYTDSTDDFTELNAQVLEEFIRKQCFNKSVKDTKTDYLYNYNRKKFGGEVLISKQVREELWRPGNIYLLVDCSGSIANEIIDIVIQCVSNVGRKCGSKSRLIWWDTGCRGDIPLSEIAVPVNYGGGTTMYTGINYIKENYLKFGNDKLIIISDYLDTLSDWNAALEDINNDVIGVCWAYNREGKGSDFLKNRPYYRDPDKEITALIDKVKTTFISLKREEY